MLWQLTDIFFPQKVTITILLLLLCLHTYLMNIYITVCTLLIKWRKTDLCLLVCSLCMCSLLCMVYVVPQNWKSNTLHSSAVDQALKHPAIKKTLRRESIIEWAIPYKTMTHICKLRRSLLILLNDLLYLRLGLSKDSAAWLS